MLNNLENDTWNHALDDFLLGYYVNGVIMHLMFEIWYLEWNTSVLWKLHCSCKASGEEGKHLTALSKLGGIFCTLSLLWS